MGTTRRFLRGAFALEAAACECYAAVRVQLDRLLRRYESSDVAKKRAARG